MESGKTFNDGRKELLLLTAKISLRSEQANCLKKRKFNLTKFQ